MMLGMRIALLRWQRGLSQAELARRLNVSTSAVGMYEQGRRMPSLDLIVQLAREFSVTTDYLLTGESPGGETSETLSGIEIKTDEVLRVIKMVTGKR